MKIHIRVLIYAFFFAHLSVTLRFCSSCKNEDTVCVPHFNGYLSSLNFSFILIYQVQGQIWWRLFHCNEQEKQVQWCVRQTVYVSHVFMFNFLVFRLNHYLTQVSSSFGIVHSTFIHLVFMVRKHVGHNMSAVGPL